MHLSYNGIILQLIHAKRSKDIRALTAMYNKLEKSLSEYEVFYSKFALNDKLRIGQSYFMLAAWYFYDNRDCDNSYGYIEKALATFRDCNGLAKDKGLIVKTVDMNQHHNTHPVMVRSEYIQEGDVGHWWPQIFEIYILGLFFCKS